MTVTTTADRKYFPGDGANKIFPFNFKFFDNSQIYVSLIAPDGTITPRTINVDYSVSGAMSASGGTVTMIVAPPLNYKLLVQRKIPLVQPTSVRNQGAFFAGIHEDAFDRLTMLIQEVSGRIGRVLEYPASDPETVTTVIPNYIERAYKVFTFDELGNPSVSNFTIEQIEQQPALAQQAAEDAAASAILSQKWAENPENVPVTSGLFSAHHWANKSGASATASASSASAAATSESNAAATLANAVQKTGAQTMAGPLTVTNGIASIPFNVVYDSGQQAINNTSTYVFSHGLLRSGAAVKPVLVQLGLICVIAEFGFVVGEEKSYFIGPPAGTGVDGFELAMNTTQIRLRLAAGLTPLVFNIGTGATLSRITAANWRLVLRAYA